MGKVEDAPASPVWKSSSASAMPAAEAKTHSIDASLQVNDWLMTQLQVSGSGQV